MSYKVGYKKPPRNTRFKPGQSGNLHGRRGQSQNLKDDPPKREVEKAPITDAGKPQALGSQEVTLQQLCEKTMEGDAASSVALARMVQRQLREEEEKKARKDVLAPLANNPDRAALLKLWRELYKSAPPAQMSRRLLTMAIAYKLQEQAYGGLKPSTRRYLRKVADAADAGRPIPLPTPVLPPGSRLLREWHGNTYEVTVLEKGVEFNGKNYRSLTEVASLITGVHWSGPAFFGLRKKSGHRKRR